MMRDERGRFIKGHAVPDDWRESIGEKNGANMMGHEPWNKGTKGAGVCKPNSGSFQAGTTAGSWLRGDDYEAWNKGLKGYKAGEGHWNWNGGVTPENRIWRNRLEYDEWRKGVFERDDFTCQSCGQRGGDLHAHHIVGFGESKELRFDVNNGQTLCRRCHYEVTFGEQMPDESKWGLIGDAELYGVELRETPA